MSLTNILPMIQTEINRYFCSICLTFGVIGCLLNILLFSRKQFRNTSCCTYFLSASISMLISLSYGVIPYAYSVSNPNPINTIFIFCKIRGYVMQYSTMTYRWLIVMACIDRYILSSANVHLRGFANPRIAYRVVLIISIIWLILPIHFLIYLAINAGVCTFPFATIAIYNSIFTIILGGLLPPLIMILCAVLISSNLASKRERRRHIIPLENKDQSFRLLESRDRQVLLMLFVQAIFYIILTIPWTIYLLYGALTLNVVNKTKDRIAIEIFFKYIVEIFAYTYSASSFYLYTLTSHRFRQQLIKTIRSMLTWRNRCCAHPQRIGPIKANIPPK